MLSDISKINLLANTLRFIKDPSVIVLHGAGVSVAAGIPDFRTPNTGFFSKLQKFNLKTPEEIFDINYFRDNPKPFYFIASELLPGKFKPTKAHFFSKLLDQKDILLRNYTQNIDGLERATGISEEKIVEAHGHFRSSSCIRCGDEVPNQKVINSIKTKTPVYCECGGLAKPDIVFYGENLPWRFFRLSQTDFANCKCLIVIGTSLKVFPFASLVDLVDKDVPRFLINNEKVGNFKYDKNDFYIGGDCQNAIELLVHEIGWEDEFMKMLRI
ncbi:NAD-dependent protein deacetylase Sirt2-like isoform X2 [Histomonas meleagridis]|uniref:NAD-dependent protein deacetylase Sirt2-like isoform X2 n=1 Tax=Histomonas meleagridis TaxID=135588 RepID=UPI00355A5DBB|nr:NAD-dependent protein deacetylase Sirt2-like isoform X2 [Histomonas meleagridis]KAH0805976.1 NAD-dependent protein deacetylase Sirt2-like isoform X2 [Histomonas meleagridis]